MPFGCIDYPVPLGFAIYTGVDALNLGAFEGLGYLLQLQPFDASVRIDFPAPPMAFGCIDFPAPLHFSTQGAMTSIYPAATGNAARSSLPTDTPANTWVPGRVNLGWNFSIKLFGGADPTTAGTVTLGVIQLEDPEGELDGLLSLGLDSAPLTITRGDPSAMFNSWSVVAKMATSGMLYDPRKKEIQLRDLAWQLSQGPLHGILYGGTGGADGDASLLGALKPYTVGQVFNISPVQINAAQLIYQVSHTSVLAIDAVRDGGAPLSIGADFPDWASLAAASVTSGSYATCLALGLFRLSATPVFIVTADVRGDNDFINALGYPSTRAQIARRIATGHGPMRLSDPAQIDITAFHALDQNQPATIGYYWTSAMSKADALNECMAGCLGYWCVRVNGLFAAGQLEDPATATPVFTLNFPAAGLTDEVRVGEPSMTDYAPPRRATVMGWAKNYTVMSLNQIAGSVSLVLSAIYQVTTQQTTSNDPWVANGYPSSPVVIIDGGFAFKADAQLEGDRQQRLCRVRREAFDLPAAIDPFGDVVARVITLANANRLSMGASKKFFAYGITVNGDAMPILSLWG
jgi:hypothetical protein